MKDPKPESTRLEGPGGTAFYITPFTRELILLTHISLSKGNYTSIGESTSWEGRKVALPFPDIEGRLLNVHCSTYYWWRVCKFRNQSKMAITFSQFTDTAPGLAALSPS